MHEYIVGIKSESENVAPHDWMDTVCQHRGVIKRGGNLERILIKSSEEIVEQLEKKFPYLKIEFVIPYPDAEEKK